MALPTYARPTLSSLLKHNSLHSPVSARTLVNGTRRETAAFKESLGIQRKFIAPYHDHDPVEDRGTQLRPAMSTSFPPLCSLTLVLAMLTLSALAVLTTKMKRTRCSTCDRNLPTAQFPKHPEGSKCEHERETCRRCWHQWLEAQVASKPFDQISCAQCNNILAQGEIRTLAMPAVYQR